ncbi:protein yraQ [Paenibacillus sp. JCM 10914]|nr:protein yraQ [Paenibacillus sp. JCM 10914]
MTQHTGSRMSVQHPNHRRNIWLFTIFIIIAATGLTYVKWWPYYDKALTAIVEHSIGSSIIEVHADGTIPSCK